MNNASHIPGHICKPGGWLLFLGALHAPLLLPVKTDKFHRSCSLYLPNLGLSGNLGCKRGVTWAVATDQVCGEVQCSIHKLLPPKGAPIMSLPPKPAQSIPALCFMAQLDLAPRLVRVKPG